MDERRPVAARCTECGAGADEPRPRSWKSRWRLLVAFGAAVVVGAAVAAVAHAQRQSLLTSGGNPIGSAVVPSFTLADMQAIAAGERDGAGLFDGVLAIGEGWHDVSPGELRLWPEFSDPNSPPTDSFYYRALKLPPPLKWSEVAAMRRSATRDRELAQKLLKSPRLETLSPALSAAQVHQLPALPVRQVPAERASSFCLKITPDPEVLMSGSRSVWSIGIPVATASERRYARDRFFGPTVPVPPKTPLRPFRFEATEFTVEYTDPAAGGTLRSISIPYTGAVAGVGVLVATAIIASLLTGALQARRTRLRRERGACVACGYQMATPV